MRFLQVVILIIVVSILLVNYWLSDEDQLPHINDKNQQVESKIVTDIQSATVVGSVVEDLVAVELNTEQKVTVKQILAAIRCRNIPKTDKALSERVNQALVDDDLPEMIESLQRKYEMCQGVAAFNSAMIGELVAHGEAGDEAATLMLWRLSYQMLNEYWDIGKPSRDEYVARKHQFDLAKFRLARQQAAKGSELAMLALVRGYYNEDPEQAIVGGQNYIKSLAYSELVLHLSTNDNHYNQAQWFNRQLRRKMTADEVQQSTDLFDQLLLSVETLN